MVVTESPSCDGIVLRPLLPEHVTAAYVGWLNDLEVIRFTEVDLGETADSTVRYVEEAMANPTVAMWRIVELAGGRHIGNIRLSGINRRHRHAEVALIIGNKDHWGRGVATVAIVLASRYGFIELCLHKLTAGIYEGNIGSYRAFEKAGYHLEATLKEHVLIEGTYCGVFKMARFADDRGA